MLNKFRIKLNLMCHYKFKNITSHEVSSTLVGKDLAFNNKIFAHFFSLKTNNVF